MTGRDRSRSERVFRALLMLFPARFREEYGTDAEELFRDRVAEVRSQPAGLTRLWLRTVPDLVLHGAIERVSAVRRAFGGDGTALNPDHEAGGRRRSRGPGSSIITAAVGVRFAVRGLRRSPGFALLASLCLTLGLGSVIAILAVINGLFLRPLPGLENPDRLVTLHFDGPTSVPNLEDVRAGSSAFEGIGAFATDLATARVSDVGERVLATVATADYFTVLGTRPAVGRFFLSIEDGSPGGHPVAVVSHDYWHRRLAGDAGVIGQTLRVNGHPLTVVGVAPAGFLGTFLGFPTDVWVPLSMARVVVPRFDADGRSGGGLEFVARLAEGATLESARAQVDAVAARLEGAYPADNPEFRIRVLDHNGLDEETRMPVMALVSVLLGIAGLVLLIAGLNFTNMLVARTAERTKEVAIRRALGVGRFELIVSLLTENLIVALAGTAGGLLLAQWLAGTFAGFLRVLPIRVFFDFGLDWRVVSASIVLALTVAIATGFVPALRVSGAELTSSLKGAVGAGRGGRRLRRVLLAGQLAGSTTLLVVAGLFLQTIARAGTVDPGFRMNDLRVVPFLDGSLLGLEGEPLTTFFDRMVVVSRAVPGVIDAAMASSVPRAFAGPSGTRVEVPGLQAAADEEGFEATIVTISPGYASTLGIPLLRGRDLRSDDVADGQPVALVSQAMAERFWPGQDAVGRSFRHGSTDIVIVGVLANVARRADGTPVMTFYRPHAQSPDHGMNLFVRLAPGSSSAVAGVRGALSSLHPDLPTVEPQPVGDFLLLSLLPQRVASAVGGGLGAAGLFLAVLGVYGMVAFSIVQRRREIGLRMAVGATRRTVLALVFGDILRLAGWGVGAGVLLAFVAGRLVRSFLVGVSAAAPVPFLAGAALVTAFALLATVAPARRAASVDPMVALSAD